MIQRAADRGLALAKETLGILYQQGLGVPRNLDTAERYYRESIAAGRTNTQALLDRLQQSRANAQQAQAQAAAAERERQARLRREAEEEAEAEAEEEAETAAANRAALSAVMGMIAKNGGAGAAAGVGGAGAARPSTRGPVSAPIQGCAQLSERGVLKNICGEQLSFFGHNGPDTNVQPWLFVNAGETRIVGNYYRYIVACKPRFEIERYHPQCAPE